MSMSWSHSAEAYEYARQQLHKLSKNKIVTIWAEWKVWQSAQAEARSEAQAECEENGWEFDPDRVMESQCFNQTYYKDMLKEAKEIEGRVGKEALADDIWEWAEAYRTCDNTFHNAYMCPYGCGPHMVPFGPKEK